MLSLPQELVLLALVDKEGKVGRTSRTRDIMAYALAGSIIMELILAGRVEVELPKELFLKVKKDNGKLKIVDSDPTGDEVLDEALAKMRDAGKERSPFYWIKNLRALTTGRDVPTFGRAFKGSRFFDELAEKGVVYKKQHSTLGYKTPRYPLQDEASKNDLVKSINDAIFKESNEREMVMLINLAQVCSLTDEIISAESAARGGREKIAAIMEADPVIDFLCRQIVAAQQSDDAVQH